MYITNKDLIYLNILYTLYDFIDKSGLVLINLPLNTNEKCVRRYNYHIYYKRKYKYNFYILHTLYVSINIYFHFIYDAISNDRSDGWLITLIDYI